MPEALAKKHASKYARNVALFAADLALVFAGGALGAFARFGSVHALGQALRFSSDLGVFCVNMLACTLAGALVAKLRGRGELEELKWRFVRAFLQIGFLGGFSTLAALDLVLVDHARSGDVSGILLAIFWLLLNVSVGIFLSLKAYRATCKALDKALDTAEAAMP